MKKIFLIAFLNFTFVPATFAQDDLLLQLEPELFKMKIEAQICELAGKMYAQIMTKRQNGVSISELMNERLALEEEQGKKSNIDSRKIKNNMEKTRALINKAYEIPRYETTDMQQKAIDEFYTAGYLDCSKQHEPDSNAKKKKISDTIENLASVAMADEKCGFKINNAVFIASIASASENFENPEDDFFQKGGKYYQEVKRGIMRIDVLTQTPEARKSFCNRVSKQLSAFFDK